MEDEYMRFIKNNLKVIIAFIVGVILAGGIVYATTSASQVSYTTDKNLEINTVAEALNDLYNKQISNGKAEYWNKGVENINKQTTKDIDIGFIPSCIIFSRDNSRCDIVYNSSISTTQQYINGTAYKINYGGTGIVTIGTTNSFRNNHTDNTETWYWYAIK